MAGQFPWTADTPELDYATTESSGERIEEFHSPPTPEAQVAGLASCPGDFVESFAGTQYGYESGADEEILQNDFDEEATCALHATIGFEGQQAANGTFYLPYPAPRLGFEQVQTIGATTTGHDLLATPSAIPFEGAPFVQPIESVPFNERVQDPDHMPPCFTNADIRCFNCGQDPTIINIDHNTSNSPSPRPSSQDPLSPSPSQHMHPCPSATPRPKVRISPPPASAPRSVQRAATCEWCGKTFSRLGGLPRHQASSCPKRPIDVRASLFACNQCRETRTRRDKIQLHCQKKHGQEAGKERFTERM